MDNEMHLKLPAAGDKPLDRSDIRDLWIDVRLLSAKVDALTEALQSEQSRSVEVVDQRTGMSSFVQRPRALAHVDTSDWNRKLERTATGLALHTWPRGSDVSSPDCIQIDIPADNVMWLIKTALDLMAYEYRGDDF